MQIWLVELRNISPHLRMLLKHLDLGNNPVAELLSPLRTVSRNIFYKAL